MFKSIGTKILVLFVVNVIGWVSLLSIIFYFVAAKTLEQQVDSNLKTTAVVLASQWDGSLLLALSPGMEQAAVYRSFSERLKLLQIHTQVSGIYIAALDRTNIVASDPALRIGQPLPRLDLLQEEVSQAEAGKVAASRLVAVGDRQYKSAIAPIYSGSKVAAVLMIDMSPWYLAYLRSFRNSLLVFTAIALCCCALSARWFSRTITTPISQVVQQVEEIGKAQYEKSLDVKGHDELATLASSMEAMRKNILHRDVQMKMMLSGIAHEIRNPLGGMELFAGILEKEKLSGPQQEYVRKVTVEIQNLKRLLNEFLEYASPRKLDIQKFSMADLMAEIHTMMSEDLNHKQARWKVRIPSEVNIIEADRLKLKQALLNLYRNAYQAIPAEGEIDSTVQKNGTGIILKISNTQQNPLPQDVATRLFEPFFTTKEKGIGLGLPLARRIVEAHGGELELAENSSTRITFALKLPSGAPS